jgi:hypothetical protein
LAPRRFFFADNSAHPDADGDGVNDTLDEFLSNQCVQSSQFQGSCANYPGL